MTRLLYKQSKSYSWVPAKLFFGCDRIGFDWKRQLRTCLVLGTASTQLYAWVVGCDSLASKFENP